MKRRTFLRAAGVLGAAGLAGAALPGATVAGTSRSAPPAPQRSRPSSRIVVVGAGAFGGWTALHLRRLGHDVTLVDAFGAGNARATSGGDSRGIRVAYGDRALYSRWSLSAMEGWRLAEEEWSASLLIPNGRLQMAPEVTPRLTFSARVLDELGVENAFLTPEEVAREWPQISVEGVGVAHFEPGAAAIRSALACRVVAEGAAAEGVALRIARAGSPVAAGGRATELPLIADGNPDAPEALGADAFVFACGPWLPALFPDLLGHRITVPRRDVFFFGPPPGDARFGAGRLPGFSEGAQAVYGFPDMDGLGLKVAPYGGLDPFRPDTDDRAPAAHWLQRARAYLALRFPAMARQPLIHSRICQLENTADEHFIVDRHPEMENVWIAGGGSGHAFKHGPVLGSYVARRVVGEDPDPEATRLFRLER
jgi:sarcosine oxidase